MLGGVVHRVFFLAAANRHRDFQKAIRKAVVVKCHPALLAETGIEQLLLLLLFLLLFLFSFVFSQRKLLDFPLWHVDTLLILLDNYAFVTLFELGD